MFLHLGGDILIEIKDVIAIIDIEKNKSKITEEFLNTAKEEGFITKISKDDTKSIVIAEIKNRSKVFLSSISSTTLQRRAGFINVISDNQNKK